MIRSTKAWAETKQPKSQSKKLISGGRFSDPWLKEEGAISELLDGGFGLQQDGNAITDGIDTFAFIALQTLFSPQNERLATNRAGEDFEQVRRNHAFIVAPEASPGLAEGMRRVLDE